MRRYSAGFILTLFIVCGFATVSRAQTTVRAEAERFAGAVPETVSGYLNGQFAYILSGGLWPAGDARLRMPSQAKWYVWVRYMDNFGDGQRSLKITVNNSTFLYSDYWIWRWRRVCSVDAQIINISLVGPSAYCSEVDSLVFTTSSSYDPNIKTLDELTAIPEVLPTPGFAQQYLNDHPGTSLFDWTSAVGDNYGYPKVPDAPTTDENGSILASSGQAVFPICMFDAGPSDSDLASSKLNTYLGWPGDSSYGWVPCYSSMWRQYDMLAQSFNRPVNPLSGKNATLLHYICDEPENVAVSTVELQRLNAIMKLIDPTKPTYINVSYTYCFNSEVLHVPDIVGLDYYPVPTSLWGQRIRNIGWAFDKLRYYSDMRPAVFTAQSFDWGRYISGQTGLRMPTAAEIRAMSYLAIVHNARGLFYYQWPTATGTIATTYPDVWQDMKRLIGEIDTIKGALLGPEVANPFTATVLSPAGAWGAEFRVAVDSSRNNAYLIAVNPLQSDENWPSKVRVDFSGGVLSDVAMAAAFAGQQVTAKFVRAGCYDLTFTSAPCSGVFRLSSAHLSDLHQLSKDEVKAKVRAGIGLNYTNLEAESFTGAVRADDGTPTKWVGGAYAWVGGTQLQKTIALPPGGPWYVWVRYLDNFGDGKRTLRVNLNGTSQDMSYSFWGWKRLDAQAPYSDYSQQATIALKGVGTVYAAGVDSVMVTDDYTFVPYSIRGRVRLNDYLGDKAGMAMSITLANQNAAAKTYLCNLDENGDFLVQDIDVAPGTFDITIKADHFLSKTLRSVSINGDVRGLEVSLINGDCDGDNEITSTDLSILGLALGSNLGDAAYDQNADLDGDGEVTSTDLSIVGLRLGLSGE